MDNKIFTLLICLTLASCGGIRTFHEYARAGDTIAVPVGMQPDFSKDNITVNITDSDGILTTYEYDNAAIRGVVNLYPDPVSNMTTSRNIGVDTSPFAAIYADTLLLSSNWDKDYFQTTVFIDLPGTMATGLAGVEVTNGTTTYTSTLDIIPGTGSSNTFSSDIGATLPLDANMLDSMSRSAHTVVTFGISDTTPVANTIPNAIEINLVHLPDSTVGGSGKAFVVNPLGHRKNVTWHDDGTNMKIILTESTQGIIDNILDYKFYVSGTATGLTFVSVEGYDNNGNTVNGLTSTLTNHN